MAKVYQQVLRGDRSSERGIRFRRMKPTELDALSLKAAQLAAVKPGVAAEHLPALRRQTFVFEGIKAMLVAVTKAPVPKPEPVPALDTDGKPVVTDGKPVLVEGPEPDLKDDALWQPVDVGSLTLPGPLQYDELFEGPDHDYLKALFSFNHEANYATVDAILKKERAVSTG